MVCLVPDVSDADIPIVQLSLDRTQEPAFHYALGKELRVLRNKGILIIAVGTWFTICA